MALKCCQCGFHANLAQYGRAEEVVCLPLVSRLCRLVPCICARSSVRGGPYIFLFCFLFCYEHRLPLVEAISCHISISGFSDLCRNIYIYIFFFISLLALVVTLYLYILYHCRWGIFACIGLNTVWLCFVCQVGDSQAKVGGWLLRSQSASTCPCKVHFGGDSWKSSFFTRVLVKLGGKETHRFAWPLFDSDPLLFRLHH